MSTKKARTRRRTLATVVVILALFAWGVLEALNRRDIGSLKAVVDPCVEKPLSDPCRARTCVRIRSVARDETVVNRLFPACRRLLERVEQGALIPAPGEVSPEVVTSVPEAIRETAPEPRPDPEGGSDPGDAPRPTDPGAGTAPRPRPPVDVQVPDVPAGVCVDGVGGLNCP